MIMNRTRDGFTDMDWDKLKVFHAAAEAGSFTHAGEQLGLSQSAVSRQVSALEQELSVSLFHRHARGLILTEQGEVLHMRYASRRPPNDRDWLHRKRQQRWRGDGIENGGQPETWRSRRR